MVDFWTSALHLTQKQAGSKVNPKSTVTVCDYYSPGGVDYLGQFQSQTFASTSPSAVKQFCLDHYAERS